MRLDQQQKDALIKEFQSAGYGYIDSQCRPQYLTIVNVARQTGNNAAVVNIVGKIKLINPTWDFNRVSQGVYEVARLEILAILQTHAVQQAAAQAQSSSASTTKESPQQSIGSLSSQPQQSAVAVPSSHATKAQKILSLDELIRQAKDVHEKYKGGKTDSEKAKASAASTALGLLESMKNSGGTPSFSDMQRYAEATTTGNLALCSTHTSRLFSSGKTNTQTLIEKVDEYLKQTQETTFDSIENLRNGSSSSQRAPT